jgi:ribosomal protein S18 acetylase RimI-like enzyme
MLDSLEAKLRQMHVAILGLHVFAENEVAFNLYRKLGYVVVSYNMQKGL